MHAFCKSRFPSDINNFVAYIMNNYIISTLFVRKYHSIRAKASLSQSKRSEKGDDWVVSTMSNNSFSAQQFTYLEFEIANQVKLFVGERSKTTFDSGCKMFDVVFKDTQQVCSKWQHIDKFIFETENILVSFYLSFIYSQRQSHFRTFIRVTWRSKLAKSKSSRRRSRLAIGKL